MHREQGIKETRFSDVLTTSMFPRLQRISKLKLSFLISLHASYGPALSLFIYLEMYCICKGQARTVKLRTKINK